jgi:intracellular sulfur oxidation DsrE/DsrF family protein
LPKIDVIFDKIVIKGDFMRKFLLVLLLSVGVLSGSDDLKKAVFDLTTSSINTIESRLIKGVAMNSTYYQDSFKELDVIVVIHGDAYKFFVKDISKTKIKPDGQLSKNLDDLHQRLKSLTDTYRVKFVMCEAGMKSRDVTKDNILEFVQTIPSAMMGLIDAQNSGYAFIPVY